MKPEADERDERTSMLSRAERDVVDDGVREAALVAASGATKRSKMAARARSQRSKSSRVKVASASSEVASVTAGLTTTQPGCSST
ncbi:MAG: hypothetical protein KIT84_42180 [Labilithrix sp.]|nr:hypothetical protein [Labilithrix sp.]MCW5817684.1 hypothetical protein [Labilithrix sp.]